jgi:CubicO group peptidase (beta-lactamase class C family)/D-alanyl-D-alanine dipeptidase
MTFKRKIASALLVVLLSQVPVAAIAQPAPQIAAPDYQALSALLKSVADQEVADKNVPSLSYAIVNRDGVQLFGSAGFADKDRTIRATADSVYRAGSVSKLFTDLIVMQLVEEGKLDIDVPVTTYLSTFRPHNPYGAPITLRQLMTHRSGLVREPPVGSYFDPTEPSLKATVDSLNSTTLVAPPGTLTKYSNGGIAVVGRVLEVVTGKPYEQLAKERILTPLGMSNSGFSRRSSPPPVYAEMASYDGPRFPAPGFDLGTPPAGSLYTSANDLAKFGRLLLGRGSLGPVSLIREQSLNEMWTPQFGITVPRTFGLGFLLSDIDGHRSVSHTGGLYGFITNFIVLPDDDLAVMSFGSLDDNPLARRFAQFAARATIAARSGQPLPQWQFSKPVPTEVSSSLAGTYRYEGSTLQVKSINGRTLIEGAGKAAEIRALGDHYLLDDAQSYDAALSIAPGFDSITLDGVRYGRTANSIPADAPQSLKSLIGEYGWDHNLIRIFERDGKPWVMIEWTGWQPMRILDKDRWAFPDDPTGLYPKEQIRFVRNARGEAVAIDLNGIIFKRRYRGQETLAEVRSLARNKPRLREKALLATPPAGTVRRADGLVEITRLDPAIRLHINYATSDNFIGFPVYDQARAFAQRPVAEALVRVQNGLERDGYGLTIHDAYRPWFVTRMFWDATPDEAHLYVADPAQGSRHNRGAAIDLTLNDLASGKVVEMVSGYDEMSNRSFPQYLGGTSRQRWLRDRLRIAMETEGFNVFDAEWWHFDFKGWQQFPIANQPFSTIR